MLSDIINGNYDSETLFHKVEKRLREQRSSYMSYKTVASYVSTNNRFGASDIIKKADEAMEGMMILPGTDSKLYFVGNPPKWHENPVNDKEYVWGLNRTAHWKVLMKAYFLTGDKKYADKVTDEIENWIDNCPCPPTDVSDDDMYGYFSAPTPWRSLETGIRIYSSWGWVFEALFEAELMTVPLFEKMVRSIHEHGEVLEKICPRLWPDAAHNHYFMENLGLFTVSLLLPELKDADRWRKHSMHELSRCVFNQFTACGGQIEGCPLYHNVCVHLLRMCISTAQKYGVSFPAEFSQRGTDAINYSLHAQRPSGTIVPWGDSDANTSSIRSAVDGYLMFHDKTWINILLRQGYGETVRRILTDYIWDIPNIYILLEEDMFFEYNPDLDVLPTVKLHSDLSQVSMRTSWDKDAMSVFFACRIPSNNGHAHIDPMSFDFVANGKPLLVDPGRFTYREGEDRISFKSPMYHNTLTVNNKFPFEYVNTWSFGVQKSGGIDWVQEKDIIASEAQQTSYEPIEHKRLVAIINSEYLLVCDRVSNLSKSDSVQLYFHFDDTDVTIDKNTAKGQNVRVTYPSFMDAKLLEGRVSDFIDVSRKSTRLFLNDETSTDSERIYACVCTPYTHSYDVKTYKDTDDVIIEINGNKYVWSRNGFYNI